jgi:hypothetical protein
MPRRVSAQTVEAERLRRWIVESWGEPFVSVTDTLQMGPGSLRESGKVRALFGILAAHGWLIAVERRGRDTRAKTPRGVARSCGGPGRDLRFRRRRRPRRNQKSDG